MLKKKKEFEVEKFIYNGFSVEAPKEGWGQKENYTAQFKKWTNDPGIAECICSDGKERLIPTCCLIGDLSFLPKQDMSNKVIFGNPSSSC